MLWLVIEHGCNEHCNYLMKGYNNYQDAYYYLPSKIVNIYHEMKRLMIQMVLYDIRM